MGTDGFATNCEHCYYGLLIKILDLLIFHLLLYSGSEENHDLIPLILQTLNGRLLFRKEYRIIRMEYDQDSVYEFCCFESDAWDSCVQPGKSSTAVFPM